MNTIKQVSNSSQVSRLVLRGYKSIVEYDLKLDRLNILNGANADCHWSRGGPDAIQREWSKFRRMSSKSRSIERVDQ